MTTKKRLIADVSKMRIRIRQIQNYSGLKGKISMLMIIYKLDRMYNKINKQYKDDSFDKELREEYKKFISLLLKFKVKLSKTDWSSDLEYRKWKKEFYLELLNLKRNLIGIKN